MKRAFGVLLVVLIIAVSNFYLSWGVEISDVVITEDQSIAIKFVRHTVTGISTPLPVLPDVPGFLGSSYLTVGDIDNNGVKEIIGTSGVGQDANPFTDDGAIAIFTWDGSNIDNWTQSVINETFTWPNETIIRDMDGDGDNDIMVMDHFILGAFTGFPAGIYYLENQGGDITISSNWLKKTIYQGDPLTEIGKASYHRAYFLDVDGDGLEDFITAKVSMSIWSGNVDQYRWVEWFEKDGNVPPGDPSYDPTAYTPHEIGEGGGFLFNMVDMDGDGDLDVIGPQFFITNPGTLVVKGPGDTRGDTLAWFENPGQAAMLANPDLAWTRYTIDNWYTSSNPLGKGFEVIASDIDDDGDGELLFTNHNHQEYIGGNRIWPSGIYLLEIPADPTITGNWSPITIETGDPNLDPDDPEAVAADVYAVDHPGTPFDQGSPGMVRAGDINSNSDSYLDLVVAGDGKGAHYYYQNDGVAGTSMNLRRATLYEDPACMPGDAQIADIDGDGKLDIVVAVFNTSVNKADPLDSSSIFVYIQDRDIDDDGICNPGDVDLGCSGSDNCPYSPNPLQEDTGDSDGVGDACDNCSTIPNGPNAGSCTRGPRPLIGTPCTIPGDNPSECGTNGYCSMAQEDTLPPSGNSSPPTANCGDACECEGNFDPDEDVDGVDAGTFKDDFGRFDCTALTPCNGDFDCSGVVDGMDAIKFKIDFGRLDCPSCATDPWCVYE